MKYLNLRNTMALVIALSIYTVPLPSSADLAPDDRAMWEGAIKGFEANGVSPDEKAKISIIQRLLDVDKSGGIQELAKKIINEEILSSKLTQRNKDIRRNIVNTIAAADSAFVPIVTPPVAPEGNKLVKGASPAMAIWERYVGTNGAAFGPLRSDIPGLTYFGNPPKYAFIAARADGITKDEGEALLSKALVKLAAERQEAFFDPSGAQCLYVGFSSGRPDGTEVGTLFMRFYISRYADSPDEFAVVESDGKGGPEAIAVAGKDYETFLEQSWTEDGTPTGRKINFAFYQARSPWKPDVTGDDDFIRPVVIPATK